MPPAGALVVLLQVELAIVTSIYGGAEKGWFFTTGPGTGTSTFGGAKVTFLPGKVW